MDTPLPTKYDDAPGQAGEPLTLAQIRALPQERLEQLSVFFEGGWVRPLKWMGSGDDIEVVQ